MNVLIETSVTISTTILGSIANSTSHICSYLWYGSNTNVHIKDYQRRVFRLDIPDKIKFTDGIIFDLAEPLKSSIIALCSKINTEYININIILHNHTSKWLNSYRNIDIDDQIKDLEVLVEILDRKLTLAINSNSNSIKSP